MPASTDSLIEALAAPPEKRVRGFHSWFGEQTPERQAALRAAALDDRWSHSGLTRILRDAKAPCSKETIAAWRRELGYAG